MAVKQPPTRQRTSAVPAVSGTDPQRSVSPNAPKVSKVSHNQSMSAPAASVAAPERGRGLNQMSHYLRDKNAVGKGSRQAAGVNSSVPNVSKHNRLDMTPEKPVFGTADTPIEIDQFTEKQAYQLGIQEEGESPSEDVDWHYQDLVDFEVDENISELLTDSQLAELSDMSMREYEIDENSRADSLKAYDKAMKAARAETSPKSYPFENAANVKYPLINTATLQFAARAYPAIVKGGDIVKVKVNGDDDDGMKAKRAERIASHMSYQLLEQQPEWEKQVDELLHHLPLSGTAFKCVYYDTKLGRNTTELVNMKDFVVNNDARSLKDCPRYTRIREYYPNEIKQKMRNSYYRQADLDLQNNEDSQKVQTILEQHRMHDLDGDGVDEPYVVTLHKESREVLRVVPSADLSTLMFDEDDEGVYLSHSAHEPMYVRYIFIPDPEGKIYGIGFGQLLETISESINTTLNQMLDAGHLQNAGGGFIGGNVDFGKKRTIGVAMNKWQVVTATGIDIRQAIVPHNHQGPSAVLFNLLGLLIDAGKEVSNIKDVLSGDASSANMPVGTTMALIEQGLQQFTAIYKRIYRSLTEEFKLLYRLNGMYLDDEDYSGFHDSQEPVGRADYQEGDDIVPISDPTSVTSMQKMAKLGFVREMIADPVLGPTLNPEVVARKTLEGVNFDDIDEIMAPPPTPEQQQEQAQMKELETRGMTAEVGKLESEAFKNQAQGQAALEKVDIDAEAQELNAINAGVDSELKEADLDLKQQDIRLKQEALKNKPKEKAA